MAQAIRLLLIEDSQDDAVLLLRELQRAGFEPAARRVDTLDGIRDALAHEEWDLVISDYSLPGFDGLVVLELYQAHGIDVPFVIVSGTIGEDVAVEAMRAGAHDYLMKGRLARLGPAVERELREAADRRARRTAEEAYRSLVESSLQGFLIVQDETFVFANPAVAEMFGYTVTELESLSSEEVIALVHPDDLESLRSRYMDRLTGKTPPSRYQCRLMRKNGEICWVEMAGTTIDFGGRPAVQATLMDVSERVLHEREQRAIATVATSLRAAENRTELVGLLLEQVLQLLDADGVALAMRDTTSGDTVFEMARGAWTDVVGGRVPAGEGLSGLVITTGEPYLNNDVADDPRLARVEILSATRAIAGVPLIAASQTIGVLWIGRHSEITTDDQLLLTSIAEMTASALRRIKLNEELVMSHEELTHAYDSTLEGWARALELRDSDTEGHTRRVVDLAVRMGTSMGLDDDELVHLRRGALLHDIGKMAIPDQILRKPGALDEHEWDIMRRHPVHAYEMLSQISYLRPALDIPYCHHEKWDGSGYPRGLRGEAIPLTARIFAVVDVWDAVRSDRPYRAAWSEEKAIDLLSTGAGSHFDPALSEAFLQMVGSS